MPATNVPGDVFSFSIDEVSIDDCLFETVADPILLNSDSQTLVLRDLEDEGLAANRLVPF